MRALIFLGLFLAVPVAAETVQQHTEERHLALGSVAAHVLPDGTAYAVDGTTVLPLTPAAFRLTGRRVVLQLPDRTLTCVLPDEALVEDRGVLHHREGTTSRSVDRFRVQTWTTDCPDGPAVVWKATDHSTLATKGP